MKCKTFILNLNTIYICHEHLLHLCIAKVRQYMHFDKSELHRKNVVFLIPPGPRLQPAYCKNTFSTVDQSNVKKCFFVDMVC